MKQFLLAKKSLGQNFLKNQTIIDKIVLAGDIQPGETIIEIGPGTGALTNTLLDKAKKNNDVHIVAIEKDRRAVELLKNTYTEEIKSGYLDLIEGDILEIELVDIVKNNPYKIIANIPYYITGAIIRKSLETSHKPKTIILLVQKEVAERIVCRNQKPSILSHSVQVYGDTQILMPVSRGNFVPAPKVDSAVLCISNVSNDKFNQSKLSPEIFFKFLHAGFGHKRKKLFSNIYEYLSKDIDNKNAPIDNCKEKLETIFKNISVSIDSRAEELTNTQWLTLVSKISSDILYLS